MKPYDVDEIYRTLNTVAPYDWRTFFDRRLQSKSMDIPLGGVDGGGFRLIYNEKPNMFTESSGPDAGLNAYGSLGIYVSASGVVADAWQGRPAFAAGLSVGMKIIAVNGRRFSVEELSRALAGSKDSTTPLEFIVENASYFKVVSVDYHGGLRYPHLERTSSGADLLTSIAKARTQ